MNTKLLRQKILDLAIRGKLVPQDPNDEPASVLLERIKAEKEKLIKEKKIKPDKKKSDAKPHYQNFFEIPDSWEWCRLGDLAYYKKGPFGSSLTKSMFVPKSNKTFKVYEQKNAINKDETLGKYFISESKFEELKGFEVFSNDIIVSCAGTIGETFILPNNIERGIINQALMIIRLHDNCIQSFYLLYFDFVLKKYARNEGKGTAIKNIPPFDVLKNYLIPLPPLAEQFRIVAEIERLFALIDTIEESRLSLEQLVKQAKSKVLNLAIRGKLVPQDPHDEPASELLKHINPKAKITTDTSHYPFEIPETWEWCSLYDIADVSLGKTLDRLKNTGVYKCYLRSVNVKWGNIDLSDVKEMKFEETEEERYRLKYGDLLICEGGEAGRAAVWKHKDKSMRYQNAIHRVRFNLNFEADFYLYVFWYYYNSKILDDYCKGVTIKHLTGQSLKQMGVPLPPVNEQKRIVSQINKIFAQLDIIEDSLKA